MGGKAPQTLVWSHKFELPLKVLPTPLEAAIIISLDALMGSRVGYRCVL